MEFLRSFRISQMMNNCFLIRNKGRIILIDAPDDIYKVIDFLEENNLVLDEVWLTHFHFDHVLGLNNLKEKYPNLEVYSSKEEIEFVNRSNFPDFNVDFTYPHLVIDNAKLLNKYDGLKIEYIGGHSLSSSVYIFEKENIMFTGDILFRGAIGRFDLVFGDYDKINNGIKDKLFVLDENMEVYPGHGFKTTIGFEKENNKLITWS